MSARRRADFIARRTAGRTGRRSWMARFRSPSARLRLRRHNPIRFMSARVKRDFAETAFLASAFIALTMPARHHPIISGPFNDDCDQCGHFYRARIGAIVVHPTLPGTIFVASGSGIGGIGGQPNNVLPERGLYRSTDATSADPTFTKMVHDRGGSAGSRHRRYRNGSG